MSLIISTADNAVLFCEFYNTCCSPFRILDFAKFNFNHWINSGVFRSRAHSQSDIIFAKILIRLNFYFPSLL